MSRLCPPVERSLGRIAAALLCGTVLVTTAACGGGSPRVATPPDSVGVPTPPATSPTSAESVAPGVSLGGVLVDDISAAVYGGTRFIATLANSSDGSIVQILDANTGMPVSGPPRTIPVDWSCGLAVVAPTTGSARVVGMRQFLTPSRGIEQGNVVQTLVAFDVETLQEAWTAVVATDPDDGYAVSENLSCVGDRAGLEQVFRQTSDARAGLVTFGDEPVVVDLVSGAATPVPDAVAVLSKWLLVGEGSNPRQIDTPATIALVDPLTFAWEGATDDPAVIKELNARTFGAANLQAAVSSDHSIVVLDVNPPNMAASQSGLTAYRLPGLERIWSLDRSESFGVSIFLEDRGTAVTFADQATADTSRYGQAVSLLTGMPVWSIENSSLCSVAGSVVTVTANRQLAFLDAADGTQLAFDPTVRECPRALGDTLVVQNSSSPTVSILRVGGS